MALLFMDGFDKYGPPGQNLPTVASLLTAGEWTTALSGTPSIVAGLSAIGNALNLGSFTALNKTLTTSPRQIGGVRFRGDLATACFMSPLDGGTQQCTVRINQSTGTISVCNGGSSGTVLATSSTSVSVNSIHYLEWDITIGAAANYQVWLDGVSILSGTGNTKATANNSANGIQFGLNSSGTFIIDDFYLFDSTGSTNNAVLLSNPIVETAFPTGDAQTQWSNGATVIGQDNNLTNTTDAPGANFLFLRAFTPAVNMTLNSVSCVPGASSSAAKLKAVLYAAATTGSARIAAGTEVVGTISGATLTAPFASGQALTAGTTYAIGFITDTSVALRQVDNIGTTGVKAANTYASGAPATLPTMTTGQPNWQLWGNCTGSAVNWPSLTNNPAIDDLSYAFSSTVNQEDHYSFPALSNTPAAVYAVAYKARAKRSDSGTRTADIRCVSGGANSAGTASGFAPPTTFSWLDTLFEVDPNTGVAWSGSGVNSAVAGPKIAS
jgi:hypothetical protein